MHRRTVLRSTLPLLAAGATGPLALRTARAAEPLKELRLDYACRVC